MKESIKESAFERRQELPAGTVAAPLCQPLKFGADYRDVTAALKMKRLRRLWGDRLTFLAVAMLFRQRRRREEGVCSHIISPSLNEGTISNAEVTTCDKNVLCRQRHERVASRRAEALTSLAWSFFYFFEIKEREKGQRTAADFLIELDS